MMPKYALLMLITFLLSLSLSPLSSSSPVALTAAGPDGVKTMSGNNSLWLKDCSTDDDKTRMELVSYNITPNPPKKGDKMNFDVEFELKEEITSGVISVIAKIEIFGHTKTFFNRSLDLCELIQQSNYACPLQAGPLPLKIFGEKLPDLLLSGRYTANATISDQNGKEMLCLQAAMVI